jgi:hypothetical protein
MTLENIVQADERQASSLSSRPDEIRRRVVDMAADRSVGDEMQLGSANDFMYSADPNDRAALDLYLALLQDRLPILVRAMSELQAGAGRGTVEGNLVPVAQATVNFYSEILSVKLSVLNKPAQLVRLRKLMQKRGMGPDIAVERVGSYLRAERKLNRIGDDVDAAAVARLLVGACVNYVFTELIIGEGGQPPREEFVVDVVRALRLNPAAESSS